MTDGQREIDYSLPMTRDNKKTYPNIERKIDQEICKKPMTELFIYRIR